MIPKVIHYCWFGRNPLPDSVKEMKKTWEKFCPDYKIIEWNEDNFDINQNNYCKEAYESGKWAFVADYARLKILYDYGGFYLDTDVEIIKLLDPLLTYNAVVGFESKNAIATCTIGAVKNNDWIKFLLDDYNKRHFIDSHGNIDSTTNVKVITELTKKRYHLNLNGKKIIFGDNMVILPFDYLCAKSWKTGKISETKNTYTIHNFEGSWLSKTAQVKMILRRKICRFIDF